MITQRTWATRVTLVALVAFVGCDSLVTAPSANSGEFIESDYAARGLSSLDGQLWRLLGAASPGGARYFVLPRSTAFGDIPQDPKNRITTAKVELGQLLMHETALAVNNVRAEGAETYSCGACHVAAAGFRTAIPQGIAEGGSGFGTKGETRVLLSQYDSDPSVPDLQPIRVPTNMNVAYQEVVLWNGQFGGVGPNLGTEARWEPGTPLESNLLGMHGLETQAHAGLAVHRMGSVELSRITTMPEYQERFRRAFPGDASPINRLNAALAIAAFERTMLTNEAPFQRWLRGQEHAMTRPEKEGALLFFGKANCVECHTGPALSSMSFHAFGMNDLDGTIDPNRVDLRPFDGTIPESVRRGRGGFTGNPIDDFKFKTPQLYNLADAPFYGHGSSFNSIRDVVAYKNAGVPQNPTVLTSQLAPAFRPLGLSGLEVDLISVFLEGALHDPYLARYVPLGLPSGNCMGVNDAQARLDMGC